MIPTRTHKSRKRFTKGLSDCLLNVNKGGSLIYAEQKVEQTQIKNTSEATGGLLLQEHLVRE